MIYQSAPCIKKLDAPVLTYRDIPYNAALIFNAGVTKFGGRYVMVFRNDYGSVEEHRLDGTNIGLAYSDDGIEACRMALLKLNKGILDGNFIEGKACIGGCIGGAGCLTHGEKNKAEVDKYGREAHEKNISDAISLLK